MTRRCVSSSQVALEQTWKWKISDNLEADIRFRHANERPSSSNSPKVLLLHGFGVGSWHYERNLTHLAEKGSSAYAIDILGQGESWPNSTPVTKDGLYISIDLWLRQLVEFSIDVMGASSSQPIVVVGNSLGGFLAVQMAAQHPHLVKGICLLNATPFWSFLPPVEDSHGSPTPRKLRQGVWSLLPEQFGTLPVPSTLQLAIREFWWDILRKPETIRNLLGLVYYNKSSVTDHDVERIIKATDNPLALDVFAAIALSPKSKLDFNQALKIINNNGTPCLMLYGREDPWVVPLWGSRLKRKVESAIYCELSPAGHCPANEVPRTVNEALSEWIKSTDEAPWGMEVGGSREIEEENGRVIKVTHLGSDRLKVDSAPINTLSRFVSWLDSFLG